MKKCKRTSTSTPRPLDRICESFIDQHYSLGHIAIDEVARFHMRLRGLARADVAPGFVTFLKRSGINEPTTGDLTAENIANFWEFLAQRHGLLEAADAMRCLKQFWFWCMESAYIPFQLVPADLIGNGVVHPYRVSTKIKRSS